MMSGHVEAQPIDWNRAAQLEERARCEYAERKAAARDYARSMAGSRLLLALEKGDVLASWNNKGMQHLRELELVEGHNLMQTNGRLAVSKRWSITAHGRDLLEDRAARAARAGGRA